MNLVHTLQAADAILGNMVTQAKTHQNLQVVIHIATGCSDILGPVKPIKMFESFKSFEGLYHYLGSVVNVNEDPKVHFKYIQLATSTDKIYEAERICHESSHYNPKQVRSFLKKAKLVDKLPLIIVCDRFHFVLYLYQDGYIHLGV
ncbi:armadillo-type protein [Mycena galopus ATCC 62051]|nr:armadillo-type protein [Mycena galopus ATCC 62051]